MSKQRLSRERWRELIAQQRAGELTVVAFCRRHGLAASTFFNWKRRLESEGEGLDDAEVAACADEPSFVEVTPEALTSGSDEPIEVLLSSGVVVRVRRGFDTSTLRQLVEALS